MDHFPAPQRILIVNPFGIGDVLFTTPLIAALKERYPSASLSYIGNARTASFLKNDPRLSQVFSYERDEFVAVYRRSPLAFARKWLDFVKELRSLQFDTAFDLSLGAPLALALVCAGIPVRIGYDYKQRGRWLTHKLPLKGYEGRHVVEYYLDLIGVQEDKRRYAMAIYSSIEDDMAAEELLRLNGFKRGAFIVVHPGGGASWGKGSWAKRWPAVNFAKLADKMIEKEGLPIILMGDASEAVLCGEVAGAMKHKPLILAGLVSITRAAALMRLSRWVIANDGGPLHTAVASGAKTLSIFGPVDPAVYGPYPAEGHVVVQKRPLCQPCYRNFRMSDCDHQVCLRELSPDDVFAAFQGISR